MNLSVDRFEIEKEIGKGAYGTVYKVRDKTDNQIYAMKKIAIVPAMAKQIAIEFMIGLLLQHPNIPRTYFNFIEGGNGISICQYISGVDLYTMIKHKKLTKKLAKRVVHQILSAINYCHKLSICHLDIKPQNILFDKDDNAQLIDWGMASKDQPKVRKRGTPNYMPPEMILSGTAPYCDKADIWSIGILTLVCLTGNIRPYGVSTADEVYKKVVSMDIPFPNTLDSEDVSFIKLMLRKDPQDRPSAEELLRNHWFD